MVRVALPVLMLLAAAGAAHAQAPSQASPTLRTGQGVPAPFQGGVPSGAATREPLSLTMADAIGRALEHNLGLLTTEDGLDRARGARWLALASLLPAVNGSVAESRRVINLKAFGFPRPPGVPPIVGPFNVFDARLSLSQAVLDFEAINKHRAEAHNVAAARYLVKTARDLVVSVAGNTYVLALAASARAESARAQLDTARALFAQVTDMKQGGLVAGIDVLRAEVQLDTQRQRVTAAENDFEKGKLQLAHAIGLPLGQPFTLADPFPVAAGPDISIEEALDRAYKTRPDYLASLEWVRAAEAARQAVVDERMPSVRVTADYGTIGLTVPESHPTFSVVGGLSVPIFNGGRTSGRLLEADADLRSRRAEAEDLKASIYYDMRTAFLDVEASSQQLRVATRAQDLAAQQLTQARDRFAAGVASNIEVVQAQEAVAASSEQYIAALYNYDVSNGLITLNLGEMEETVRPSPGGGVR